MSIRLDLKTRFQRTLEKSRNISGKLICRQLTYIVDAAIIGIYNSLNQELKIKDRLCIIPIGGYGRMELAPYSDIDLLYLHDGLDELVLSEVISKINTYLFDSGKEVGHSCRTIEECHQYLDNQQSYNALLDSRYLIGSETLFKKYTDEFLNKLPSGITKEYNDHKLNELRERILDAKEPLLISEPNLKNDPCGLRDIQRIYWIEKSISKIPSLAGLAMIPVFSKGEIGLLEDAYDFFLRVRIALHVLLGRKGDRLELTFQPDVAEYLGFGPKTELNSIEKLMTLLYKHQKEVYFFLGTYLDYKSIRPAAGKLQQFQYMDINFQKNEKYIYPPRSGNLFSNPETLYSDVMRIFFVCQKSDLEPSRVLINDLRFASNFLEEDFKNFKPATDLFLEIIRENKNAGRLLTLMHECNILGKLIPEFGACTYFALFSYHHQYTVDEHSLFILRELDRLADNVFEDKEVQREYNLCNKKEILILSVLIHDAGKVKEGDHCQYGAELATAIGERLALSEEDIDLFRFLVERHIDMSELSSKRDISDPRLISDFAKLMGNLDRLRLLYVFTIVDTKSVGPGILTNWKKEILYSLFQKTKEFMETNENISESGSSANQELESLKNYLLQKEQITGKDMDPIINHSLLFNPATYISYNTPRRIFHQFLILNSMQTKESKAPVVELEKEPSFITMTVYSIDYRYLLSDLTGIVTSEGLNVIGMRSFRNSKGYVINQIQFTDPLGSGNVSAEKLERLPGNIAQAAIQKLNVEDLVSSPSEWMRYNRIPVGMVNEKIEFNNELSPDYTILEVRLPDSLGLLYRILRQILSFDIQLHFVRVSTSADFAYDSFYLKSKDGIKIEDKNLLQTMAEKIKNAASTKYEAGSLSLSF
ncbi:MAG: HD domain-containing protein [Leptospira sp.]|nr:HD domain-containing protein [Leptospira sp.]